MTDALQSEAALGRVAKLAESWAALAIPGAPEGVAAEVDAHCGRLLLDVIHSPASPAARLDRVTCIAEAWLAPGDPGLFYPAAGQCVLDAIRGGSTGEEASWRQRAERAEAKAARLEAALRRHLLSFTDPKGGGELCGGCLQPSPCPDAGLLGEEP